VTARTGTRRGPAAPFAVAVGLLAALIGVHVQQVGASSRLPAALSETSLLPDSPTDRAVPAPSPAARTPGPAATAAVAAGDAVATATPGATLGIAVLDQHTGAVSIGVSGAVPMYAASLVKIVVALDVVTMRRSGLPVLPADLDLIRRALGPSDDEAMNTLWVRFDGHGAVGRVASRLGLTETLAPDVPSRWGEALTSARDVVALYEHVLTELPAADRDLLLGALAAAPPVATDGFDQAYGLFGGAPGLPAVSKQGWMCCLGDRITLHSAGLPHDGGGRYVVALLSSVPRSVGYDGARTMLTATADAVRAPLS